MSTLDVAKVTFVEPFPEPELSVEEPEDDALELIDDDDFAAEPQNVNEEEARRILESNSAAAAESESDSDDGPIELTLF